ncbi:uncharacterized protein LOC126966967 [Leptidea sinapis]|uniref:uncharacterized protein LOC126966967 n=1 Tax=Leptidea sinapis TaxID=189913 RepID=UPI0021C2B79E|nr:uncharacterized protein LOC126966967 [Leptidea sinapis]
MRHLAVSSILTETLARASYIVVKDALVVEYILLSINALFLVRSTAKKFIKNLNSFDESLNIYTNNKLSNNTFEELSFKTNLDISSVHKAYEQLHNCSTQLNRMISFPMMVIIFSSGLSTIMYLKNIVTLCLKDSYYTEWELKLEEKKKLA